MYQIGNEKEAGDTESCHHADLVARHLLPSDEEIPDRQEDGARPVEEGVDSRQAGNTGAPLDLGSMPQ